MKITVIGTDCAKCKKLFDDIERGIEQTGATVELDKLEEIKKISSLGVLMIPALIIDGRLIPHGELPSYPELLELLEKSKA